MKLVNDRWRTQRRQRRESRAINRYLRYRRWQSRRGPEWAKLCGLKSREPGAPVTRNDIRLAIAAINRELVRRGLEA